MFLYGAFIFASIFAYTELMDRNRYAHLYEILKSVFGLYLVWQAGGDWFGARDHVGMWYVHIVTAYCILSAMVATLLVELEIKREVPVFAR